MIDFYLGTHEDQWLWQREGLLLFVSHNRLLRRKRLHPAVTRWGLDSGAFTHIAKHGRWTFTPREYVTAVRRYASEIGSIDFAAPMDMMCEPYILARTGLTIPQHHEITVTNYVELRMIDADLRFIPSVQGWTRDDFLRCVDLYGRYGVDLAALPKVGLGTVCRRQSTREIDVIVRSLAPLRLHGFGVKTTGLLRFGNRLVSADSLAWSYNARRHPPLPGHRHKSCANCAVWAERWRSRIVTRLADRDRHGWQGDLFDPDEAWDAGPHGPAARTGLGVILRS